MPLRLMLASVAAFVAVSTGRAADDVKAPVDARVAEWWPTASEKRFDAIGWAPDLRAARRLAAEHDRPVFLFTMDGRVNTGRC
jgi:hypothetical protein